MELTINTVESIKGYLLYINILHNRQKRKCIHPICNGVKYASYLDVDLQIDTRRRLNTKLYDKRADFDFPIVNFPFLSANIPEAPAYGVYISQLIRYSRACDIYLDFIDRARLLAQKLLNQGYVASKLQSFFLKFYGRHHDLVDRYDKTVSKMKDLFT